MTSDLCKRLVQLPSGLRTPCPKTCRKFRFKNFETILIYDFVFQLTGSMSSWSCSPTRAYGLAWPPWHLLRVALKSKTYSIELSMVICEVPEHILYG